MKSGKSGKGKSSKSKNYPFPVKNRKVTSLELLKDNL